MIMKRTNKEQITQAGYLLIGVNFAFSIVLLISGIESGLFGLLFLVAYTFISWRLYKWRRREVNKQIERMNKRVVSWIEKND